MAAGGCCTQTRQAGTTEEARALHVHVHMAAKALTKAPSSNSTTHFCIASYIYWRVCSDMQLRTTVHIIILMTLCLQSGMCQPQRALQDVSINEHAFIRVHVHPKRFPAVYTVDWKVSMQQHTAFCSKPCCGLSVFCVNNAVNTSLRFCNTTAMHLWLSYAGT